MSLPDSPELNPEFHGLTNSDEQRSFATSRLAGIGAHDSALQPLAKVLSHLEATYCSSVGFEFEHLTNPTERRWFEERVESRFSNRGWHNTEQRKRFARLLLESEIFDAELHRKYVGSKRFSLQGGKTVIPMLDALLGAAAQHGVTECFMGMAHRGRLNVLVNLMGKPFQEIFAEFEDKAVSSIVGAGDVKYHLGFSSRYGTFQGKSLEVTLAPNPSHLEFVNPVVEGMVRAKQDTSSPDSRGEVMAVLIHGDAAFAGQGIVYETLNFSKVPGYDTGGTVHVVINNQVGFTTNPKESRSSAYCTDMAKGIDIPVFHVNGRDVEAACWVMELAEEFRATFHRDVVVDLLCYRKFGHNEGDDPSFTQPLMYAEIKNIVPIPEEYGQSLVEQGVLSAQDLDRMKSEFLDPFKAAQLPAEHSSDVEACPMQGRLRGRALRTAVAGGFLQDIGSSLLSFPEGFTPHPKLKTILEKRVKTIEEGQGIEWGLAEALAFGSLILEGRRVRLSGQDCGRGTFSHRHLELHDYEKEQRFYPLRQLAVKSGRSANSFEVYNSTLSEAACLGFEFGYSATDLSSLVLWEAQFGDFANGAQVIIDQFLSSSEAKWSQRSGVVLLLPHGYEGQGPEHSSARLERFLQLCAEGNMSVCCPSNAAQYFHLVRRQGLSEIKRPLVVMSPKSLLRLPEACSALTQFTSGDFQPVISEAGAEKSAKSLLFMSGKIFYDVQNTLRQVEATRAQVVRIEELYPFPEERIGAILKEHSGKSLYWVQEEPQNMGAWSYVEKQFRSAFGVDLGYLGRPTSASTAAGSPRWHSIEVKRIMVQLVDSLA